MLQPSAERPLRRRIALAAVFCVAVALIAGALWIGFTPRHDSHPAGVTVAQTAEPDNPDTVPPSRQPITASADGEQFARSVALAIFGWDTRDSSGPLELVEPLMAVADPTGESSAGLASDLTGYLPTGEAWAHLREYRTRQWLTITSVSVPDLWASAVEQADGSLLPGTHAYTVTGVRHRAGVWEDEPVTSEHPVAFTVFVVCSPSYPECHLLRLSRLDDPLD